MYTVELIWNREFHWIHHAHCKTLSEAKAIAKELVNSGDGMRVKKARVLDKNRKEVYSA